MILRLVHRLFPPGCPLPVSSLPPRRVSHIFCGRDLPSSLLPWEKKGPVALSWRGEDEGMPRPIILIHATGYDLGAAQQLLAEAAKTRARKAGSFNTKSQSPRRRQKESGSSCAAGAAVMLCVSLWPWCLCVEFFLSSEQWTGLNRWDTTLCCKSWSVASLSIHPQFSIASTECLE